MDVYLDHSATTKPSPAVFAAMQHVLQTEYGNPSSAHRKGFLAEQLLKEARAVVATALGANSNEIIFTSGGTEANNLALQGSIARLKHRHKYLVTTQIEHSSVSSVFKHFEAQGYRVTYLGVDQYGFVKMDELQAALAEQPALISMMMVNNEIGTIQSIAEIGALLNCCLERPLFHVDAVQAFGKVPFHVHQLGVDLLSISGHKIYGPKGIGALYIKTGTKIDPIFYGGGHESALRPGTQNVPGIVGMGVAAAEVSRDLHANRQKLALLKHYLIQQILAQIPKVQIHSPEQENFTPNILNVSFYGIKGEVLLHTLETDGIYVSTGSACNSHKKSYSHVLTAIGLAEPALESAIRFSFSPNNTTDEIDYCLEKLQIHVNELRQVTTWR